MTKFDFTFSHENEASFQHIFSKVDFMLGVSALNMLQTKRTEVS